MLPSQARGLLVPESIVPVILIAMSLWATLLDAIEIEVHPFETGPFRGRDIRIKNRYIA